MPVYRITSTEIRADGCPRQVYLETENESLGLLTEDLRGGPICGRQLFVKPSGEELVVIDSRELTITAAFVRSITIPDKNIVEYEDVPDEAG